MTNLINLTPHAINVITSVIAKGGEEGLYPGESYDIINVIEPSGTIARCETTSIKVGSVNGINIMSTIYGHVNDLPDVTKDTMYVVSALVANALPDRTDLLIPNDMVRDAKGNIVGCRSFASVARAEWVVVDYDEHTQQYLRRSRKTGEEVWSW